MTQHAQAAREPLGTVLHRLRVVLQQQADALSAEDFDGLARLDAEREQLVAALIAYTAADTRPEDHGLLDQVGALDQRLLAVAREELRRTGQELREVHRGRGALNQYRQRGQTVIHGLARLDLEG
jgi:hypothetical protein